MARTASNLAARCRTTENYRMTTISIKGRETSDELNLDTMCKHIALLRNLIVGHTLLHRVHDSTPHDTPSKHV